MAQGVNMVMTVIGFIVSTMFIVFVCTRLICARIRYLSSRRSSRLSSRSDLTALERGLRGVEPLVVSNFHTKKFNDPFFSCAIDAQCSVCLSEFRSEDTLRILPFCGHFFHSSCIDIWLQQHCTCPICRVSLRELANRDRWVQPMVSPAAQYSSSGPDHLVTQTTFVDHVRSTDNGPSSVSNEGGRVTNDSSNS